MLFCTNHKQLCFSKYFRFSGGIIYCFPNTTLLSSYLSYSITTHAPMLQVPCSHAKGSGNRSVEEGDWKKAKNKGEDFSHAHFPLNIST